VDEIKKKKRFTFAGPWYPATKGSERLTIAVNQSNLAGVCRVLRSSTPPFQQQQFETGYQYRYFPESQQASARTQLIAIRETPSLQLSRAHQIAYAQKCYKRFPEDSQASESR
jgi:hypothetical protein